MRKGAVAVAVGMTLAACSGRPPIWVRTLSHPDYTGTRFITAVGSAPIAGCEPSTCRERARRDAFTGLARSLEERLSGRVGRVHTEWLDGVKLLDAFEDEGARSYSILALLDLELFADSLEERVAAGIAAERAAQEALDEARGRDDWHGALARAADLATLSPQLRNQRALLTALRPGVVGSSGPELGVRIPAEFRLRLQVVGGLGQELLGSAGLAAPLVVSVSLELAEARGVSPVPLRGLAVRAATACDGVGLEPAEEITDAQGEAAFRVTRLPAACRPLTLTFAVDLPEVEAGSPTTFATVRLPALAANERPGDDFDRPELPRGQAASVRPHAYSPRPRPRFQLPPPVPGGRRVALRSPAADTTSAPFTGSKSRYAAIALSK